jgi:hypothetical protein
MGKRRPCIMNLDRQYVNNMRTYLTFEGLTQQKKVDAAGTGSRKEELMIENVHSILMLSLRCFERLFGTHDDQIDRSAMGPAQQDDPYVVNLLRLLSK